MYLNQKDGWIEVICGPMFAGKTEELLRRVKRLEYAKKNIVVFKPLMDDRYSESEVHKEFLKVNLEPIETYIMKLLVTHRRLLPFYCLYTNRFVSMQTNPFYLLYQLRMSRRMSRSKNKMLE